VTPLLVKDLAKKYPSVMILNFIIFPEEERAAGTEPSRCHARVQGAPRSTHRGLPMSAHKFRGETRIFLPLFMNREECPY
jgi:hypothetical protein